MRLALILVALTLPAAAAESPALELVALEAELASADMTPDFARDFRVRLDSVREKVPPTSVNLGLHARLLARLGGTKEALAGLGQALETAPGDSDLLLAQSQIHLQQKDYPAALAAASEILNRMPPAEPKLIEQALAVQRESRGRVKPGAATSGAATPSAGVHSGGGAVASSDANLPVKLGTRKRIVKEAVPDIPTEQDSNGSGFPLWPLSVPLGAGLIGYGVYRRNQAWSEADTSPLEYEAPRSERLQKNRRMLKYGVIAVGSVAAVVLAAHLLEAAAIMALPVLMRSAPTLSNLLTSPAGRVAPPVAATKTVWDSISKQGPNIAKTSIPRYFQITINSREYWVSPNATKHMAEYLEAPLAPGQAMPGLSAQTWLESFRAALTQAVAQGARLGQRVVVAGWQLEIRQAPTDPLPVIVHARYTR